jgi:mannose/fructose/N-acetylgalactosamine-specific phosphotransferase system component IIC
MWPADARRPRSGAVAAVNPAPLATVALGGVAALDATPAAQTQLAQPLVTGVLLGVLWGDVPLALETAVVLQILAAGTLPVGARTPEDFASGGVVGVGVALSIGAGSGVPMERAACALVGVLAGLLWAALGVPLLRWQRRRNEGLARWCEDALRRGHEGALTQAHAAGIALAFAAGVGYTAIGLAAGWYGARSFVDHESMRLARAWSLAQPLWLGLGLAQLLHAFVQRRLLRAAVFGAALMVAWLVQMLGTP